MLLYISPHDKELSAQRWKKVLREVEKLCPEAGVILTGSPSNLPGPHCTHLGHQPCCASVLPLSHAATMCPLQHLHLLPPLPGKLFPRHLCLSVPACRLRCHQLCALLCFSLWSHHHVMPGRLFLPSWRGSSRAGRPFLRFVPCFILRAWTLQMCIMC
jgi:hypothetical protein